MARWRLAVALMVPRPVADEVDGLRRALGDRQLGVIDAHVTLAPPTNVAPHALAAALAAVRAAAGVRTDPLVLELGPVRTFAPANRVLYLAVEPTDATTVVRDALRTVPFDRPDRRPFVPHVTVDIDVDSDARLGVALDSLTGYRTVASVPGVTLLREQRDGQRGRHWIPIADATFGAPVVVGRGGIEIEITGGTLVDPEAGHLLPGGAPTRHDLVLTARRGGTVVGVAAADRDAATSAGGDGATRGGQMAVAQLVVAPDHRRLGVGRALLAELASRASAGGAVALTAGGVAAEVLGAFLADHGWQRREVLVRSLV